LWDKHGLEQWEVEQAATAPEAEAGWETHPVHGRRLIVRCRPSLDIMFFIALDPIHVPSGIWSCRTAYIPDDVEGAD